jgi:hypothetical protein
VVTIHDLIHIRLAHLQRPGVALAARALATLAAHRAEIVIADSEATRRDILDLLHVRPEKVHVVHLGLSSALRPVTPVEVEVFRGERALPRDPGALRRCAQAPQEPRAAAAGVEHHAARCASAAGAVGATLGRDRYARAARARPRGHVERALRGRSPDERALACL